MDAPAQYFPQKKVKGKGWSHILVISMKPRKNPRQKPILKQKAPSDFYTRLHDYYVKLGEVIRGEASLAAIFPNATDRGMTREAIYARVLEAHCPSKCNVLFGGFLFDEVGNESHQLDVIITNDTCPNFNFLGDSVKKIGFACVEGTLACVSIKSKLDKKELYDALRNIASIPTTRALAGRLNPLVKLEHYDDWPFKVIYASSGISHETLNGHLQSFYEKYPIPFNRRPDLIHVSGKYFMFRSKGETVVDNRFKLPAGQYAIATDRADVQALTITFQRIQENATSAAHILFDYRFINQYLTHGIALSAPTSEKR